MSELIAPIILTLAIIVYFYLRSNLNSDIAKENILVGDEFLKINREKEGIIETNSGLQYELLTRGSGQQHPSIKDRVEVNYNGKLLNDTVFDSSLNKKDKISLNLDQTIKGWQEGIQLMVVGDKIRFFIPSKLAYGARSKGKIEAGSLLIFEVELLSVNMRE